MHFEAAVKAGKHVFTEKPVAVDAPGMRRFLAANDEAKKKNLHGRRRPAAAPRPALHRNDQPAQDGAIGDITFTRVYWNGAAAVGQAARDGADRDGVPDAQLVLLQLAVRRPHRRAAHPQPRRRQLAQERPPGRGPGHGRPPGAHRQGYGEIYDHHAVEFTYADGTKMFSQCRHMDRADSAVSEHAHGTKGTADISGRPHHRRRRAVAQQGASRRSLPAGARRPVRRDPQRRDLQRRRLRRPLDDDRHPGPHGHLLRARSSSGTTR